MTRADLATRLGVTPQSVSNWLGGLRQPPEPDTVFAIEQALDCPGRFSQLLGYQPAGHAPAATLNELLDTDPFLDDTTRRIVRQIVTDAHRAHGTDGAQG